MFFEDRHAAATQLAEALDPHRDKHALVLAIPRGAVPIAAELARRLHGDLDIVMVRKLASPGNPEFALGSVDEMGRVYLVPWASRAGLSPAFLDSERERQLQTMRRRRALYTPGRQAAEVAGRTVIVVDDGLATGATMQAALRTVREGRPSWLVCAVPVASRQSLNAVRALADEVVCLHEPGDFEAVSRYYRSFPQVEDAEVVALLAQAAPAGAAAPGSTPPPAADSGREAP